jgi:Zn-dependent protease with chaperone function
MTVLPPPYAFSATIEPTRLSLAYRFGLVIVGAAMLLLPLLYLGTIALTGAAVWWHLTSNAAIMTGDGNVQWRTLLYIGPALIGVVLMFFMVKPILAPPSRERDPLPLDPLSEPVLIEFIEAICRQVRAPVPRRVQVDCQVNASAGFMRRGVVGVWSRDLVLTIGLPLAAGLTTRQLGGVLAHEFGHFAQGGAMRLTAIVRSVNAWFARVVFERDAWDVRLEEWSKNTDGRLAIVLGLARAAIWLSRQMLRGLMMAGHAISCFMLRQMEFDADSYEIKLAGSEAFAQTSRRMREINVGAHFGYADLHAALRNRTLPAQLPAFVVQRTGSLPPEILAQATEARDERTGTFDTHPCDADRIRAAMQTATRGVLLGGDGPATMLFADFDALSVTATRHHYEHALGIPLMDLALIDTDEAMRHCRTGDEQRRAFQSFFGQSESSLRPLMVPSLDRDPLDRDRLRAEWKNASDRMTAHMTAVAAQYRELEALGEKRDAAFTAQELFCAGFSKVNAADFGLPDGTPEGVRHLEQQCDRQQVALIPTLEAFEADVVRRLAAALRLADEPPMYLQAQALVVASNALARALPLALELRRLENAFLSLVHNASNANGDEQLGKRAEIVSATIANRISHIRTELADVPCPSVLCATPMTLAEWCGMRGQDADHPSHVVNHVLASYYEVLGRLAAAALLAEAHLAPAHAAGLNAQAG